MAYRFLLADDDESIRFILRHRLESCGILVEEADTGGKAVTMIAGGGFDLVLLDMNFPDMSGAEVIERLDPEKTPSIIILSGEDALSWREGAAPAAVIGNIQKPFDIQDLTRRLFDFMRVPFGRRATDFIEPAASATPGAGKMGEDPIEEEPTRIRRYGGDFSLLRIQADGIEEMDLREILDPLMRKVDHLQSDGKGAWTVLLPETGPVGARQFAGRIRSRILGLHGIKGRIGLRTGIAACMPGDNAASLLRRAEEDLMRFSETRVDLRPSLPTPAREILLVEDDEALSFLVAMLLKNAGYLVHPAGTKREALYEISRRIPDCLILDLALPDGNGLDLLRLVRQLPETRILPVILFTALATPENKEKGCSLGADGYIVKPFEHAHLLAEIDRVTRGGMA